MIRKPPMTPTTGEKHRNRKPQDTEMQVVIVGAGRADLVAQTKVGSCPCEWSKLYRIEV